MPYFVMSKFKTTFSVGRRLEQALFEEGNRENKVKDAMTEIGGFGLFGYYEEGSKAFLIEFK